MDRILFHVRRAGVTYANHAADVLRKWEFTHSRVDVFVSHARIIARHGVVYQSDIRAKLGIARRTMSVMMQRLEKRGLIERRRSDSDRRKLVVHITALGQRAFSEIRAFLGDTLLTPTVDGNLLFYDFPTPVPVKRTRFLQFLDVLRLRFGDFSTCPYP